MVKRNKAKCKGINSRGTRCGNDAKEGSEYCHILTHNPNYTSGDKKSLRSQIWEHKTFLLLAFTVLLAFNQGVQPVFFTRISSFEKTPLYIQSLVLDNNGTPSPNYYYIYKITYKIEPAFLSIHKIQKRREIDLPPNVELFTPGSGFWDDNPYVEIKLDHDPGLLDSQENSSITLKIKPSGFTIKEVPFTLYFRKQFKLECAENIDLPFSWNKYKVDIEHPPKIRCNYRRSRRHGLLNQTLFEFRIIDISNEGDLDVKGLLITIPTIGQYRIVCSGGDVVSTLSYNKVLLNLKPGEKKSLVVINRFSDEGSQANKYKATFNFTSLNCDSDWNEYVK